MAIERDGNQDERQARVEAMVTEFRLARERRDTTQGLARRLHQEVEAQNTAAAGGLPPPVEGTKP